MTRCEYAITVPCLFDWKQGAVGAIPLVAHHRVCGHDDVAKATEGDARADAATSADVPGQNTLGTLLCPERTYPVIMQFSRLHADPALVAELDGVRGLVVSLHLVPRQLFWAVRTGGDVASAVERVDRVVAHGDVALAEKVTEILGDGVGEIKRTTDEACFLIGPLLGREGERDAYPSVAISRQWKQRKGLFTGKS